MTEHNRACFLAGQFLQLAGHDLAHATKPFDVPGTCLTGPVGYPQRDDWN